jgi:diacylglycerol kinase
MHGSRIARFIYAWRGLKDLFASGLHPRLHLIAGSLVILTGVLLEVSRLEWMILVLTITLVLVAEAGNTALEVLADAVTQDFHPLVGRAKDLAAGMVLLAALGAVMIGIMVFGPYL